MRSAEGIFHPGGSPLRDSLGTLRLGEPAILGLESKGHLFPGI